MAILSNKGEIQSTLDVLWVSFKIFSNGTTLFTGAQLYLTPTDVESYKSLKVSGSEIDPNDSSSLTLKAGILDEMGRKGEARALLKRATEVDPHNEIAQEARGQMQRDRNNKVAEAGLGIAGTVSRGFFGVLSEFVKEIFR